MGKIDKFTTKGLKELYLPPDESQGGDNGQITVVGNSDLFHGPLILALRTTSRIVDMVFLASPEESTQEIISFVKSEVPSFIWIPFDQIEKYIEKSDALLIGPGMKRYSKEGVNGTKKDFFQDEDYQNTRNITKKLLTAYSRQKWVVDAGSLQTIEPEWLPENSIITPNKKEFEILFDCEASVENAHKLAKKLNIVIVLKGYVSYVVSKSKIFSVHGGNSGLTKGGTGDVLAALVCAFFAKNPPVLSAAAACLVQKKAAEEMAIDVGTFFNASDLADQIPYTFKRLTSKLK